MTNPDNGHPDNGSRENSPETASAGADAAQQIQRRFAGHDPAAGTDTGGTPWAGRQLTSTGFDGDTGTADARLLELLTTPAPAGDVEAGDVEAAFDADTALVELVAAARLLVPVVAVAGEMTEVNGLVSDASSDMAAVTLVSPQGEKALPAFTSLQTLADWDSSARPVPVTAQRAAQAAVQEGCHQIVLDVGASSYGVLRGSMVWSLAMDRPWVAPHRDPQVRAGVEAAVADEPAVVRVALAGGPGGALRIDLALLPGLAPEDLQQLAQRVGERIALDGEVRARIDALAFSVTAAS
ncbi:SseB family protein [Ornithinimicrobium faecis]|uniref:SseB family protein n=1 Tax=Ornithinimicrobium faecis TaxID=2934158 RepID=A0ABY4YNQ9_9MICO|nr:SseB family protein [Ornithinimicrobium sp. HY1793]USQ78399.1 SseB family protein [Ornithinimicrobium sp. HY1793]